MTLPKVRVQLSTGGVLEASELHRSGAVLFVFLRHFGCPFCLQQLEELKKLDPREVVAVTMGTMEEAQQFAQNLSLNFRLVCDPDQEFYVAMDVPRGGMGQLFGPKVWKQGIRALRSGHGLARPKQDPWQLPGAFAVAQNGDIVWEHRAQTAADNPSLELLSQALTLARSHP